MDEQSNTRDVRQQGAEGSEEGLDLEYIKTLAGFVLRSGRRRPVLVSLTFVCLAALGLTAANNMPRTYTSQVKLFAQRAAAMHMLTSPNPGIDQVESPTKNVPTMILRRDNLLALVKQANLADHLWDARPPLLRLKDRLLARIYGPMSDEDKLAAAIGTLEVKLDVEATDDSSLTISVDWNNPQMAYDLVTLVQTNFLEARYDNEVAVITDSIAVLHDHAKTELAQVDDALEKYQKIAAERAALDAVRAAPPITVGALLRTPSVSGPTVPPVDPDLANTLEKKRLQIRALEDQQQRTVEALKQQLVQAKLTLTPLHPQVISLEQQIEAVSQPSPDLAQLRGEERTLMAQIAAPVASAPSPSLAATSMPLLHQPSEADAGSSDNEGAAAAPALPTLRSDRDGVLRVAASELETAIHEYENAMRRIDAAKVELDITRAAYKYRYTVVRPAELPKKPKKQLALLVGTWSIVGALVLAFALAALVDLGSGRVLETWQLQRRFKLDVLGEFDLPS
jgi:uncharacterized protein involved in exopolysaccharide biosynthesis